MTPSLSRGHKELRRVVVTGIGAVTPLGTTWKETWLRALEGQSGVDKITRFDASQFETQFAAEVKGFNPDLYIEKKEQKKMDLFIHFALASAKMAVESSNLKITDEIADRVGVIVGAGMGGLPLIEEQHSKLMEKGPSRVSPFFIPAVIANLASGQISMAVGAKNVNYSITSACATGVHSIGESFRYIMYGHADYMIAGGTESAVCAMSMAGFGNMRALSTRNSDPTQASRPFDKDRDGFVLGEGATVLILESLESALKRGAPILCEVSGYGVSSDAYHMTSPAPEGLGGAKAMRAALAEAGLKPEQINYINAHATATPVGDGLETAAIKSVFGSHAQKLWISSTKSMTGHLLGAAGSIESAFCIQSLVDQVVPPTINLQNPSDDCDLDYVPHVARKGQIHHVVNNSFGFGGTNGTLIFSRYQS
jgi:3-oxoacyl-[acyl-carrier-protein] synthase II